MGRERATERPARTELEAGAKPARGVFHAFLGAVGWLVFAWLWYAQGPASSRLSRGAMPAPVPPSDVLDMGPEQTTERPARTGLEAGAKPARGVFHVFLGAVGWLLFVWLWYSQARRDLPENWEIVLIMICGGFGGLALFAQAWVLWNQRIYRRRHRRVAALSRQVDFTVDALGRPITCVPAFDPSAGELLVTLEDGGRRKFYGPAPKTGVARSGVREAA